jgi:tRNA-splicing ligase RtcB
MQQAGNLANHPCLFRHVALMPDCHQGYGMPIGGVIACADAVIPNAVGVDIGCGMGAVRTTAMAAETTRSQVERIVDGLRERIPVGFEHHGTDQGWDGFDEAPETPVVQQQLRSARRQLGTLGGGNHFIEIQAGDDGHVWLMLHSGSRNFGYQIAKHFNQLAVELCRRWHSALPARTGEDGLAFLPTDSDEGMEYVRCMEYALAFAQANRAAMMAVFKEVAHDLLGCDFAEEINIHHNFARLENHFSKNVWVHRKGATPAFEDQMGIIPGSMGSRSYLVRGLGNPESFCSCSHGAGRKMGRAEFCRTHTEEQCEADMEGIVFGGWSRDRKGKVDISEAPGAYKDIDEVIAAEADLVEVAVRLKPLGVLKG